MDNENKDMEIKQENIEVKKEIKKNKLLIGIIILLILCLTCSFLYIIYDKILNKNLKENISNNENINIPVKEETKDEGNNEKVDNEQVADNENLENKEFLNLFDLTLLTDFEKKMLKLLSKEDFLKKDNAYFKYWKLDDIEYLKLDKISYYGKSKDDLLFYQLSFKYKCKTQGSGCVILTAQETGEENIEYERAIFVSLKKENDTYSIKEFTVEGGTTYDPGREEFYQKLKANEIIENYVKEKGYKIKVVNKKTDRYCETIFYKSGYKWGSSYDVELIKNGVKSNWVAIIAADDNNEPYVASLELEDNYDIFK